MAEIGGLQGIISSIMNQSQGGAKPPSPEELKALAASRAPMGNQIGGVNTGGRHDPRMGSVSGTTAQPKQTMIMPPSRGRSMTAGQSNTDEGLLDMIGEQMGMEPKDGMSGVDVSGSAGMDQNTLIQNGLKAVTSVANGQVTPQAQKAAMELVFAVQSGVVPQTPEVNKLIDALKKAKLLSSSNLPTF